MKKYFSFFQLRFSCGLQYRVAAWAGVVTQFAWGFMEIMMFNAFYEADASAFPMSLEATVAYVWLQQAFLAFFMAWMMEGEIFETISNGNIVYELVRPISIYNMWFARSVANRLSKALLRCFPILLVAGFLPAPFKMCPPADIPSTLLFLLTMILGLLVTVALCMLVYVLCFFTVSPEGLRMLFVSSVEFLSGAVVPLPILPENVQKIMECLPFASMQNVPLRIYSGSMSGEEIVRAVVLQIFWLVALIALGKVLCRVAVKRVTLQGG